MVRHTDVIMYLVAIKSFYAQLGHGQVVIIDDGTLTAPDRAILEHHTAAQIISIRSVEMGQLPRGGTWERLVAILNLTRDSYVIQLDSDTATRSAIPEIEECIRSNRSFTLGTRQGQELVTLANASKFARARKGTHVQDEAERRMGDFPEAQTRLYVRGCSGFAGFAQGAHGGERVTEFSAKMTEFIGKRWEEWGSEQVTSNYLIANAANAVVLPHPKYASFSLDMNPDQAAFLHFIGTNRYDNGVYAAQSRSFIRSWSASHHETRAT